MAFPSLLTVAYHVDLHEGAQVHAARHKLGAAVVDQAGQTILSMGQHTQQLVISLYAHNHSPAYLLASCTGVRGVFLL